MGNLVSASENPEQKFKRLAVLRTNVILDKLRLLGNLSNTRTYSYSDDEVEKIFSALNQKVKEVRAGFQNRKKKRFDL